jgi:hypothetical protein
MQKIVITFIRLALKIKFYSVVFWILFIFSKKEFKDVGRKKTVLYLSKPIFNDDIEALKKYGKMFDYIKFPRILLFPILYHFIPFGDELNDANYHLKIKDAKNLENFHKFWDSCLIFLNKKLKFDIILSGNFVYVTQQEMIRSAKKIGIPFFVLYKEGMFPVDRKDEVISKFYTTKVFLADKILFYNEGIRNILLRSGMPGLSENSSAVVGVPRFDYLVRESSLFCANNKNIVLFAFDPQIKSEYLMEDECTKTRFEQDLFEFQANLVSIVKKRLDLKLIIKSKSDPGSTAFVDKLLKFCGCDTLPMNITRTNSMVVQRILQESQIVAGYSSTTLIEALVLDKCILCPNVSQYFNEKSSDLFQGLNLGIHYVLSVEDIEKSINVDSMRKIIVEKEIKENFLNSMIYRLDGESSHRVETEMLNALKETVKH